MVDGPTPSSPVAAGTTYPSVPESSAEQQQSHSQGRATAYTAEEKPAVDKVPHAAASSVRQADPTTSLPPNTSVLGGRTSSGGNSHVSPAPTAQPSTTSPAALSVSGASGSSNSAGASRTGNGSNSQVGPAPTSPTPTRGPAPLSSGNSSGSSSSSSVGASGNSHAGPGLTFPEAAAASGFCGSAFTGGGASGSSSGSSSHARPAPSTPPPTRGPVPSGGSYNQPGGARPHASSPQARKALADSSGRAGKGAKRRGGGLLGAVLGGAAAALGQLGKVVDSVAPYLLKFGLEIGVTVGTTLLLTAAFQAIDHRREMARIKSSLLGDSKLDTTLADVGGLDHIAEQLRERILEPLKHIHLFKSSLAEVERGVLLHGPPGTGKTMLAKALACESKMNFVIVSPSQLLSKYYGETEQRISALWAQARKMQPVVIFIDEVDALFGRRGDRAWESEASRSMLAQFLQLWDGIETGRESIVVMGATNRKDDLDEAVLRRFTTQFKVDLPGEAQRASILRCQLRKFEREEGAGSVEAQLLEEGSAVLSSIAQRTQDCCGSDLRQLLVQAVRLRMREVIAASGGGKKAQQQQPKETSQAGAEPGDASAGAAQCVQPGGKKGAPQEQEQLASGSGSSGAAAEAAGCEAAAEAEVAKAAPEAAAAASPSASSGSPARTPSKPAPKKSGKGKAAAAAAAAIPLGLRHLEAALEKFSPSSSAAQEKQRGSLGMYT